MSATPNELRDKIAEALDSNPIVIDQDFADTYNEIAEEKGDKLFITTQKPTQRPPKDWAGCNCCSV